MLGHPLFFLRLASNAFPDIGSVGRTEKKVNYGKSRNKRPGAPASLLWSYDVLTFFFETAKNLGRSYDAKRRIKVPLSSLLVDIGSLLYALVNVFHPDWLIRSNFRLRRSDNLHKDYHQNSWIYPRVKKGDGLTKLLSDSNFSISGT